MYIKTYLPSLPYIVETAIAIVIEKTGEDLFRENNSLHSIAIENMHLQPLQYFINLISMQILIIIILLFPLMLLLLK